MPKQSTGPGRTTSARRTGGTRPLGPRAQRVPSQAKSPARLKLERLSIRPLHFVRRLPKLVVPIAMGLGAPRLWGRLLVCLQPLVAKGPSRGGRRVSAKVGIDCEGVTGGALTLRIVGAGARTAC